MERGDCSPSSSLLITAFVEPTTVRELHSGNDKLDLSRSTAFSIPTSIALHSRQFEIEMQALCFAHTLVTVLELELADEHIVLFSSK